MPWQVNTLISDVNGVAKMLNKKATTDKELKEQLRDLEKSIEDVELGLEYLPEEFGNVETNLEGLSSNSKHL